MHSWYTTTFSKHPEILTEVFQKLCDASLRPNPEKCKFSRAELKYLGHIVNQRLRTDPIKEAAIKELTPPRNFKEARRFLEQISWYRRFIKDVADVAAPLHRLLRQKAEWK